VRTELRGMRNRVLIPGGLLAVLLLGLVMLRVLTANDDALELSAPKKRSESTAGPSSSGRGGPHRAEDKSSSGQGGAGTDARDQQRRSWSIGGRVKNAVLREDWPSGLRVLVRAQWATGAEEDLGWLEPDRSRGTFRRFSVSWSRAARRKLRIYPGRLSLDCPVSPRSIWVQAFADGGRRSLLIRVPHSRADVELILWDGVQQDRLQARASRLLRAGKRQLMVRVMPAGGHALQVRWLDHVRGLGAYDRIRDTDPKSGMALFQLYPGTYEIWPVAGYLFQGPLKRLVHIGSPSSGSTISFRLKQDLQRIRGLVLDAQTGKPIDQPSISVWRNDRKYHQQSGSKNGSFETGLLPPGTYKFSVIADWTKIPYWPHRSEITVPTDGRLVIKLKPKRLALVLVAQYSPRQTKPENVVNGVIRIWHREGHNWRLVFGSSMDNWRREELWGYPAGDYKIIPALDDYHAIPREQRVRVPAEGKPITVQLRFVKK